MIQGQNSPLKKKTPVRVLIMTMTLTNKIIRGCYSKSKKGNAHKNFKYNFRKIIYAQNNGMVMLKFQVSDLRVKIQEIS